MTTIDKSVVIPKAYLSDGRIMVEVGPHRAVNLLAAEQHGLITAQDANLVRGLFEAERERS